jgi:hypothetical protein
MMKMKYLLFFFICFFFGCAEHPSPSSSTTISSTKVNGIPQDRAQEIICKENAGPALVKEGISLQKR